MPLWCPNQKRTYHDITDLTLPFLSFLGVRHAITPREMDPPDGWRLVADDRTSRLIENTHAIPRVFVPRRIRFIDSDPRTLEEMSAATDFTDEAWILTHETPPQLVENGSATLQVHRIGTRYEIDAVVHSPCRIVLSEAGWPGWRAYVDNRRVKIEQANRAFLSVYVPAGRHHLQVIYLPDAFVNGRAISIGTLSLLSVGLGVRRWRKTIPPITT
jgi:hypothetical protein